MTFDQTLARVPFLRALRHTFADQALLKVCLDRMSSCQYFRLPSTGFHSKAK